MKNNEPLLPLPEVATMQPTVEDILRKRNSELEAQLAEIRQVTKEILEGESNFDALEQAVNKAHGNKHECEGLERDKVIAQLQNRIAELEAKPCPYVVTSNEGTSYCNLAQQNCVDLRRILNSLGVDNTNDALNKINHRAREFVAWFDGLSAQTIEMLKQETAKDKK